MGIIAKDVEQYFLKQYSELRDLLKPFLHCFDVTYAERRELKNTMLYTFLLKPENFIKEGYGLDKEVMLCYSPYDELQPRALQAANALFDTVPFKTRVDNINCFFISRDENVINYAGITSFEEETTRLIVPFVLNDLKANKNNSWYIRNVLKEHFYDIDLFGYMLPLKDDTSFFGRQNVIARYIDAVRRGENRGVFGVRKTGKTSLLFQIYRIIHQQNLGYCFMIDCKSPLYRRMHWTELLDEMCELVSEKMQIQYSAGGEEKNIIKRFRNLMKEATQRSLKIVFMFDEIEYISFKAPTDDHWKTEFIDFWQTLWSIQSLYRNLVFVISGVNPSVTEVDTVNGVQNPLFSIVQSEYLQGLSLDDSKNMIKTLGKRMGMRFEPQAIELLFNQYNGHPLLLRLACSSIYRHMEMQPRPIIVTVGVVDILQDEINGMLSYYYAHIVSEIKQFYPDEYEMLELLASGQTTDFMELAKLVDYTKHLYSYGLVADDEHAVPYVKMPVAGRHVALEYAKSEKRSSLYKLVDADKREEWVRNRAERIIMELRRLENLIQRDSKPKLFGENSFPEAEKFAGIVPISTEKDFIYFFNICYRCFIEPIDNYGKSISNKNYFWNDIKKEYPTLFEVLHRIRVYRHSEDHAQLRPEVAGKYEEYWKEDTEGISSIKDQRFAVQQKLLEQFLTALQVELSANS